MLLFRSRSVGSLMAIRWLENKRSYMEDQELDWLKDYMKTNKADKPYWVVGLIDGENGILVITYHWKAFIFNRESRCRQLREAIPVWLTHNEPLPRLVAQPQKGGKFMIGLDDEFIDTYWKETEPGKFYNGLADGSTQATGATAESEQPLPNPFLPGTTPTVVTPKRKSNGQKNIQGDSARTA